MSEVAVRIIAFEEEGLGLPVPSNAVFSPQVNVEDDRLPSEENRIQNLEILVNKVRQRFEIRVTRYLRGPEGDLIKNTSDVPL